jgi:hypothetical protein
MEDIRSGKARSMERVNETISTCRYCRFYQIEGRRGGFCQQLGVPVQAKWKTCAAATSAFAQADVVQSEPVLEWAELPALLPTAIEPQPLFT